MNSLFFLHNSKTIHYFKLTKEPFEAHKLQNIEIEIGEEICSKIKGIHSSSDTKKVIIIIDSTIETDLMIEWDMIMNTETDSYDIGKQYQIYFDAKGETIVATKDHCLINGTIVKAFQVDNLESTHNLGLYHGHRFDNNNHNWLITNKYIAMPFSYMSFVIKNSIETNDKRSKIKFFDIEPYNYIFNRSSSFLDSKFVTDNHFVLEEVLSNCMKIDPGVIDMLSYTQGYFDEKVKETSDQFKYYPKLFCAPLSKAVEKDNNRCVGSLLKYMSYIEHDFSVNI